MRRSKKLIVGTVLAALVLFGSLGGVALADPEEEGLKAKFGDFITKVCDIYEQNVDPDIDREALETAITDVRTQMAADRTEMRAAAMENRLQGLTDEQKEALQEWRESRPEDLPMKFGGRMHGGFRGMGGPFAPAPAED